MTDDATGWESFLAHVRDAPLAADQDASRELGGFAADWLAAAEPFPTALPARHGADALEPCLTLLRAYQRLNRALSEVLYHRSYHEDTTLLTSDFGDWAVGSLARETYLDLEVAVTTLLGGLDLQAISVLRQMAELSWRALVLAGDPGVADEWWEAIVASAGSSAERRRLDKRLWAQHFRPAQLLRHVAEIEARLDGLTDEAAEYHVSNTIRSLGRIYTLLSGTTHGGPDLVYASVVRGGGKLPEDPFEALGEPTDLGRSLVRAALHLQYRFWRYFPRAAFPSAEGSTPARPSAETNDADAEEAALLLAIRAVDLVVVTKYADYVSGDTGL
jgi:hypothetical protein